MDPGLLLRGVVLGFAVAAPVGPIGVLCIRRSLAEGRTAGFVVGLGAATADAVYGAVAGFGLTIVSTFLVDQRVWLRLVGGLFLCYLGLRTLVARPSEEAAGGGSGGGLIGAYASTFFLTLTNPTTILSFAAIFAAVSVRTGALTVVPLIVGVFLGSASWWLLLSTGASLIRDRVGPRGMRAVNIVSGAAILTFGLAAVGAGILG
ncbi:MAG TPA: LysE family transporter [Rubrobacter sp.]|nr:LysE family transporter [Rubrobacter sp.]